MQQPRLCKNSLRSNDTRVADITKLLFENCMPEKPAMLTRVLSGTQAYAAYASAPGCVARYYLLEVCKTCTPNSAVATAASLGTM